MQNAPIRKNDRAPAIDYGSLDELTGFRLRLAQLQVFQDFARAMEPWNVRPAEFSAMALVEANPGMSQAELSMALKVERAALARLIDRLEGRGFVTRRESPADRRSNALHLTNCGTAALGEMKRRARRHEARMTGMLTPNERRRLLEVLARMVESS